AREARIIVRDVDAARRPQQDAPAGDHVTVEVGRVPGDGVVLDENIAEVGGVHALHGDAGQSGRAELILRALARVYVVVIDIDVAQRVARVGFDVNRRVARPCRVARRADDVVVDAHVA